MVHCSVLKVRLLPFFLVSQERAASINSITINFGCQHFFYWYFLDFFTIFGVSNRVYKYNTKINGNQVQLFPSLTVDLSI